MTKFIKVRARIAYIQDKDKGAVSKYRDESIVFVAKNHILTVTPRESGDCFITFIDGSYGTIIKPTDEFLKMLEE